MNKYDYSIYYSIYHDNSSTDNLNSINYEKQLISPFLNISKDSKIIDIGCGYGFALLALKEMGFYNVQGLETSKEQGEKCIENGLNVSIVSDSIKWLEIRNDEFDVILLLDVLEHVPVEYQIILLKNIYNSLKKGVNWSLRCLMLIQLLVQGGDIMIILILQVSLNIHYILCLRMQDLTKFIHKMKRDLESYTLDFGKNLVGKNLEKDLYGGVGYKYFRVS